MRPLIQLTDFFGDAPTTLNGVYWHGRYAPKNSSGQRRRVRRMKTIANKKARAAVRRELFKLKSLQQ